MLKYRPEVVALLSWNLEVELGVTLGAEILRRHVDMVACGSNEPPRCDWCGVREVASPTAQRARWERRRWRPRHVAEEVGLNGVVL